MPYITQSRRDELAKGKYPLTVGELNYCITKLCIAFLKQGTTAPGYTNYNEVIGVLECAKLEFYRRVVVPYEQDAMKRNGDVY